MRSLSLLVSYWDNLDATAVVFHLPNLDFLVLVLRFHSKARICTLNSKWRSTSKFSLQYQSIVEPRGDENLKNGHLREQMTRLVHSLVTLVHRGEGIVIKASLA